MHLEDEAAFRTAIQKHMGGAGICRSSTGGAEELKPQCQLAVVFLVKATLKYSQNYVLFVKSDIVKQATTAIP